MQTVDITTLGARVRAWKTAAMDTRLGIATLPGRFATRPGGAVPAVRPVERAAAATDALPQPLPEPLPEQRPAPTGTRVPARHASGTGELLPALPVPRPRRSLFEQPGRYRVGHRVDLRV